MAEKTSMRLASVLDDLIRLRDARLKMERAIIKSFAYDPGGPSADALLELERAHDDIEELHEIVLSFLHRKHLRAER